MPDSEKVLPIEKREIRGLTAESIIKYGVLLIAALFGYFTLQTKANLSVDKIIQQQEEIRLNKVDIETLKITTQTQATTIARLEERINNLKK